MSIAVAVKHMLAAGMPHEAIVAAISEMEASAEPKRSAGAIRQQRYRERHQASQVTESDACDAPPPCAHVVNTPSSLRSEEYSVANATGTDVPSPPSPLDPREALWAEGVSALTAMGTKDREARSNIGRWLRDKHPPEAILAAIQRARDHGTRDPIPLVGRILSPINQGQTHGKRNSIHDLAAAADGFAERFAAAEARSVQSEGGFRAGVPAYPLLQDRRCG